jgi:hypothetical protein
MPKQLTRTQLNHELKKLGFGGLEDRNLMQQLACCYRTHEQFRGMLMSTVPEQRRNAYEAIAPHLNFRPKPLDVYEMEMRSKAEREQLPGYNPATGEIIPFKVPEISLEDMAQEAIAQNQHEKDGGLSLVCTRCTVEQIFRAKTRKQAYKDADREGWRMQGTKAYCPQHVPTRLTMTLSCSDPDCGRTEKVRAWDEQDGYRRARLMGWVIEDAATCPRCAAKTIVIQ